MAPRNYLVEKAILSNDLHRLNDLVTSANINIPIIAGSYKNYSLLAMAVASRASKDIIVHLLKTGATPNQRMPTYPGSILAFATRHHQTDTVEALLEYKANPNQLISDAPYATQITLLAFCIKYNYQDSAKELLLAGANPYVAIPPSHPCLLTFAKQSSAIKTFHLSGEILKQQGLIYLGHPKQYLRAATCFQKAMDMGVNTEIELAKILLDPHITGEELKNIGNMLYQMYMHPNYPLKNLFFIVKFFNEAIRKGDGQAAINLARIYEKGIGVTLSLLKAANHYQIAIELGKIEAEKDLDRVTVLLSDDKKNYKLFFRSYSIFKNNRGEHEYVNKQYPNGDSLLHHLAKLGLKKDMARLIFLGAKPYITNANGKTPLDLLSAREQESVMTLQGQLTELVTQLNKGIASVLSQRFIVNGSMNNSIQPTLQIIEQHSLLRPLLQLAKLSSLALHDLSERKKFSDPDYDSDNDETEKLSSSQYLTIRVDAKHSHIANLFFQRESTLDKCYGIYDANKNNIYISNITNQNEAKYSNITTFIHELVHFACSEIFQNNSKPYADDDIATQKTFATIIREINLRKSTQNQPLDARFNVALRADVDTDTEIIAEAISLLVLRKNAYKMLNEQVPTLLAFYENKLLPAIKEHCKKLEARALSNWPLEMFTEANNRTSFTL